MNWFAQGVGGSAGDRNRIPEIIYREEEKKDPEGSKEMWPERLREALAGTPGQKAVQEREVGDRQRKKASERTMPSDAGH